MKRTSASLLSSTALALALSGSAAFADITSQEVWDKMRSYYDAQGLTMMATETVTDSGLTLTDMAFSADAQMEGEPDITFSMPGWTLTDQDDGTVTMTWPEPMIITVDVVTPAKAEDDMADDMGDDAEDMEDTMDEDGGDAMGGEKSGGKGRERDSADQGAMNGQAAMDDGDKKGGSDEAEMAMDDGAMEEPMVEVMPASTDPEHVRFTLSLSHDTPSVVISGSAEDMTTSYSAALMQLKLDGVEVDGAPFGGAQLMLDIGDLNSVSRMTTGDTYTMETTYGMGEASYTLSFVDPAEEANIQAEGNIASLNAEFSGTFPLEMDPIDMAANITAGFDMKGTMRVGSSRSAANIQADGTLMNIETRSDGSDGSLAMGPNGLALDVLSRNVAYAVQGSDIPFPINVEATELGMGFAMPILKSEDPQDFGLKVSLRDLAVDEMIWMLIDPTGGVPHDPATLVADLAGKANWLVDIMDPAVQAELEDADELPAELHGLTLKDLQLKVAGAELTGSGDFTFDNSDLETFDGMPAPDGSVALKLVGGNTLLTTLIDMGLVPQEDALGIRMMMGIFTSPVEGEEDTLASTLEVKPDGSISANGQRLQ